MTVNLVSRLREFASDAASIVTGDRVVAIEAADEIEHLHSIVDDHITKDAITEALVFLNSIEGHGYGGEARFENLRRSLQVVARHDYSDSEKPQP